MEKDFRLIGRVRIMPRCRFARWAERAAVLWTLEEAEYTADLEAKRLAEERLKELGVRVESDEAGLMEEVGEFRREDRSEEGYGAVGGAESSSAAGGERLEREGGLGSS